MNRPKVAVVGAGAAGMTAAIFAARGGADVVLLDASARPGTKILISGGGRCNVLPGEYRANAFYSSGSANVLKRLFKTWPHADVRSFFEDQLGVPLMLEEESGKLFPKANRAKVVHEALLLALEEEGVELRKSWKVERISTSEPAETTDLHNTPTDCYTVHGPHGQQLQADRVILAAGGRSVPKTGSDGSGYQLAQELGHDLTPLYPALVPLTAKDGWWTELAGLATEVQWSAMDGQKRRAQGNGNLLFTHFGFSGPAALDASHWYAREQCTIRVAWNSYSEQDWQKHIWGGNNQRLASLLQQRLPKRLASALLQHCGLDHDQNPAQMNKQKRRELLTALSAFELPLAGTRGYDYAEVTGGGVALAEVNPSTLQSRRRPGLFFCGEIMDVIGDIGGHNFLWAWVTGKLAGSQAARDLGPRS